MKSETSRIYLWIFRYVWHDPGLLLYYLPLHRLSPVSIISCVFMRWWWFFKIIRTLNLQRQWRCFYSSSFLLGNYFLSLRLALLVCSHFRSITPIKFPSFSVPLSSKSKNWPPPNTYEWIWPAHFLGRVFTKGYWLSVWRNERRERWEIRRREGRTPNISHD